MWRFNYGIYATESPNIFQNTKTNASHITPAPQKNFTSYPTIYYVIVKFAIVIMSSLILLDHCLQKKSKSIILTAESTFVQNVKKFPESKILSS